MLDVLCVDPAGDPAPPAGGLRERKKRQTREAITEAALELFARDGFDATTVPTIAAAAGVSPATVARYFPSKEALLFPLRDTRLPEARRALLDHAGHAGDESPWRALVGAFTTGLRPLSEQDRRRLLRTRQAIARSSALRGRAVELLGAWRDMVAGVLSQRDDLTPDDAQLLAAVFTAIVDHVSARWAAEGGRDDLPAALARALSLFDDGRFA